MGCHGFAYPLPRRVVSFPHIFLLTTANVYSDVFMDSVNRERSMELIIQAARRSIGRQFIFITPQSMNKVKQTSDVKIIKMSDPERGQTALNVRRT